MHLSRAMKFDIQFGETEKNLLEVSFNHLLGRSVIRINREVVKDQTCWFSEPLQQTFVIEAGINERWSIRIEKERKQLFGQRCRVFLNQQLAKVLDGV